MDSLELEVRNLKERIDKLEHILNYYIQNTDSNNESFYQKYLEKKFNSSHTSNVFGITDIETKTHIIEIKRWNNYKAALGQLISYTHYYDNKKQKCVYFFGNKPRKIDEIISLFKTHDIDVYHLHVNKLNGEITEEQLYIHHDNHFYKWLDEHITYKENELIQVKNTILMNIMNYILIFYHLLKQI